jgi:hypothetical protein
VFDQEYGSASILYRHHRQEIFKINLSLKFRRIFMLKNQISAIKSKIEPCPPWSILKAISKISFGPNSSLGARFKSPKYGSIPPV